MAGMEKAERRLRAPKRLSSFKINRRKAVSEISIPGSGRSLLSARCPEEPFTYFPAKSVGQR